MWGTAEYMSLFPVVLLKRHPEGTSSCFLICGAAIRSTLYHVFSIRGASKRAPLHLCFWTEPPSGLHHWWKGFDVVFVMHFILVAWRQAHPGNVFKINPTSLVCLGSVEHDPVYYLDVPSYMTLFHVHACTVHRPIYWLFSPSIFQVCADFWDIYYLSIVYNYTICPRKYVQFFSLGTLGETHSQCFLSGYMVIGGALQ